MLGKVKDFFIRREITKFVREKGWLSGPIAWLNAAPGRKRGLAALILGIGAAMRHLGHTDAAARAEDAATLVNYLEPGIDAVGLIMAILGFGHAAKRNKDGKA